MKFFFLISILNVPWALLKAISSSYTWAILSSHCVKLGSPCLCFPQSLPFWSAVPSSVERKNQIIQLKIVTTACEGCALQADGPVWPESIICSFKKWHKILTQTGKLWSTPEITATIWPCGQQGARLLTLGDKSHVFSRITSHKDRVSRKYSTWAPVLEISCGKELLPLDMGYHPDGLKCSEQLHWQWHIHSVLGVTTDCTGPVKFIQSNICLAYACQSCRAASKEQPWQSVNQRPGGKKLRNFSSPHQQTSASVLGWACCLWNNICRIFYFATGIKSLMASAPWGFL